MRKPVFTMKIPPDLHEKLRLRSYLETRSMAAIIRDAFEAYEALRELEDQAQDAVMAQIGQDHSSSGA